LLGFFLKVIIHNYLILTYAKRPTLAYKSKQQASDQLIKVIVMKLVDNTMNVINETSIKYS